MLKGADVLFPNLDWSLKKDAITNFLRSEFIPNYYFRLSICEDVLNFSKKAHEPKNHELSAMKAFSKKERSLIPSYVKSSDYLLAELELREAKKRQYDDIIFFDSDGAVAEASTSNIFVVTQGGQKILTPKLSSCVLQGITRGKLMEFLNYKKISIIETAIDESDLESCSEIWFTNAIQGLRLVTRYEGLELAKDKTLYHEISEGFGRFGEKFNL